MIVLLTEAREEGAAHLEVLGDGLAPVVLPAHGVGGCEDGAAVDWVVGLG